MHNKPKGTMLYDKFDMINTNLLGFRAVKLHYKQYINS